MRHFALVVLVTTALVGATLAKSIETLHNNKRIKRSTEPSSEASITSSDESSGSSGKTKSYSWDEYSSSSGKYTSSCPSSASCDSIEGSDIDIGTDGNHLPNTTSSSGSKSTSSYSYDGSSGSKSSDSGSSGSVGSIWSGIKNYTDVGTGGKYLPNITSSSESKSTSSYSYDGSSGSKSSGGKSSGSKSSGSGSIASLSTIVDI